MPVKRGKRKSERQVSPYSAHIKVGLTCTVGSLWTSSASETELNSTSTLTFLIQLLLSFLINPCASGIFNLLPPVSRCFFLKKKKNLNPAGPALRSTLPIFASHSLSPCVFLFGFPRWWARQQLQLFPLFQVTLTSGTWDLGRPWTTNEESWPAAMSLSARKEVFRQSGEGSGITVVFFHHTWQWDFLLETTCETRLHRFFPEYLFFYGNSLPTK